MLRKIIKNFLLYSISFLIALYLHQGNIFLNAEYDKYYLAFLISWGASSFLSRKFKLKDDLPLINKLYTFTISFFLMLGSLALLIYYFNLIGVSRFIIIVFNSTFLFNRN